MIDQVIVSVYLAGILLLGLWAGRGLRTLNQYAVANRSYTSLVIFATLSASFIGGGFSMGNAEKVFLFGLVNVFALWGFSFKEILVARFIAPRVIHFPNVISVGDIMEGPYGKVGRVVSGLFDVLFCAGILGAQIGGMGKVFQVFLGLDPLWGILIGMGIVIAYSTVGGMKAVVLTDIVQFVILTVAIPLTLFLGIQAVGGLGQITATVPASHFTLLGDSHTVWTFLSLFLTFVLGETLVPPYLQRLFVGKNAQEVARGTLYSGLFSIPFFAIAGAIGLIALTLQPGLDPTLAMPFVIHEVLPIGIKGLVIAGIISIVMSSADSFLNSASVSFVNDLLIPTGRAPQTEQGRLFTAKMVNLLVGTIALVFALSIDSILDILIYAYNFWAPIILVPLVAALLGVKATRKDFLAGAIGGLAGVLLWNRVLGQPLGIDGLVVGVFTNAAAFFVASRCGLLIETSAQRAK
jgi:solute:Na+ symporter, SSS family